MTTDDARSRCNGPGPSLSNVHILALRVYQYRVPLDSIGCNPPLGHPVGEFLRDRPWGCLGEASDNSGFGILFANRKPSQPQGVSLRDGNPRAWLSRGWADADAEWRLGAHLDDEAESRWCHGRWGPVWSSSEWMTRSLLERLR